MISQSQRFVALLTLALPLLAAHLSAATFTVSSSADAGAGSLREAIGLANGAAGADLIQFDATVTSITLTSGVLPSITQALTIDGTANRAAGEFVTLNGAGTAGAGLSLAAADCVVRGMYVRGFSGSTGYGISVSAARAIIRGNVISGNGSDGIRADTNAADNLEVYGNIVGLQPDGTTIEANGGSGIEVVSGAINAVIGTAAAADRNVFSGNTGAGIELRGTGATVTGNYVGTDLTGLLACGNSGDGVTIHATGCVIRGNVLSANGVDGGNSPSASQFYGNFIGLGADGSTPLGNSGNGLDIWGSATGSLVGSTATADRNVISYNGVHGVNFGAPSGQVINNYIGTDATGLLDRGNVQHGINGGPSNATYRGNLISGNGQRGMNMGGAGVVIAANIIGLGSDGDTVISNGASGIVTTGGGAITIGGATAADRNVISGNLSGELVIRSQNTLAEGNYIGVDATGLFDRSGTNLGIDMDATGITVRGNVVSGVNGTGIRARMTGATIVGNVVGLGSDGSTAIPNTLNGIDVQDGATGAIVGGATAALRNVASGNTEVGIDCTADNVIIDGNYVGLTADGLSVRGNGIHGIRTASAAASTVIGDVAGNLVAGNGFSNRAQINSSSPGAIIRRNRIGSDPSGTVAFASPQTGIYANGAGTTVGGSTAADGNIIVASNFAGVEIAAANGVVRFNQITNSNFAGIITNSSGAIVRDNTISGGGQHGVISYEGTSRTGNAIFENSIFGIEGIAIAFGWWGPFSNDPVDADAGPNGYQNHPLLDAILPAATQVTGSLHSTPNRAFRVDLYRNSSVNPLGSGAAEQHAGSVVVTTDGSGNAPVALTLASPALLGQSFAVTAIDQTTSSTSFISFAVAVEADPFADPTITRSAGSTSPTEDPNVEFTVTYDEAVARATATDLLLTETGSLTGSTITSVRNPFGNALSLADGAALVVPTGGLNLAGQSFTIECWLLRSTITSGDATYPVAFYNASSTGRALTIGWPIDFAFGFSFFGGGLDSRWEYGIKDTWEHYAVTFDSSTMARRSYRNGALIAQDTASSGFTVPGQLYVGSNPLGDFHGSIDELRIWSSVKTQAEIQSLMHSAASGVEPGLLGLYRFEGFEDLGVSGDGADDMRDSAGTNHLDLSAGTPTVAAGSIAATTYQVAVVVGTGTGSLGLNGLATGTARDTSGFRINAVGTGEAFAIGPATTVVDWALLD
jgi:hypothetical protein